MKKTIISCSLLTALSSLACSQSFTNYTVPVNSGTHGIYNPGDVYAWSHTSGVSGTATSTAISGASSDDVDFFYQNGLGSRYASRDTSGFNQNISATTEYTISSAVAPTSVKFSIFGNFVADAFSSSITLLGGATWDTTTAGSTIGDLDITYSNGFRTATYTNNTGGNGIGTFVGTLESTGNITGWSINQVGSRGTDPRPYTGITLSSTTVAVVPEPSSTALLGLGALGLLGRRKR